VGERNFKRKTDVRWIVGGGDARAISVFRNLGGRLTRAWRRGGGAWEVQRATPRRGCGHSEPTLRHRLTRNESEQFSRTRLLLPWRRASIRFRERTFGPSESFGHVCGSIGGAFRPSSWKKCGAGAAVSMTLSGWHCAQARWRACAAVVATRGGLVAAPVRLTDHGLHYEFKFRTSAMRIPAPSVARYYNFDITRTTQTVEPYCVEGRGDEISRKWLIVPNL